MKKETVIEMEQSNGVFVPSRVRLTNSEAKRESKQGRSNYLRPRREPQQIGKILEGVVTEFFKIVKREMFR